MSSHKRTGSVSKLQDATEALHKSTSSTLRSVPCLLPLMAARVKFQTNWLMMLHLAKEVEEIYTKITGNSQSMLADATGLPL